MKIINKSPIYKKENRLWIDVTFIRKQKEEVISLVKREHDRNWMMQPTFKTFSKIEWDMIKRLF